MTIPGQSVESFDTAKQLALKEAWAEVLEMQVDDLEVTFLWEREVASDRLLVEIRGMPTDNQTLADIAKKLEDLGDDPLKNSSLPFDVEVDDLPTVTWGVVASIELSQFSAEEFDLAKQEQLIDALARLLDLDPSELQ
eukprot:525693-Rhodomonas_salina.1